MLRLTVMGLRDRWAGFIGAFVTLTAAAALITACGVLFETGLTGRVATERYAASPLVVSADQSIHYVKGNGKAKSKPVTEHAWLDAGLLDRVRAAPGGEGAVGEVTFSAAIIDSDGVALGGPRDGASLGHGWSSAALAPVTVAAGRAPAAANEVLLDARSAAAARADLGDTILVQTQTGRWRFEVVGVARQGFTDQAALFFSDAEATALAHRPGQLYAIGLPGAAGSDNSGVERALAGSRAHVVSGEARGAVEFPGATRAKTTLTSLSAVLGATALMVAMLVITATFALSIGQRTRELALLRAIAATPRQIRRLVGREALLIGVVAATGGSVIGLLIAAWLRRRFVEFGAMPPNLALRIGPLPVAVGIAATVAGGWSAARVAAMRAARIAPIEALREAGVEPRRLSVLRSIAGLLSLAAFGALLFVLASLHADAAAAPVTLVCVVLAAMAIALIGPVLVRVATTMLTIPMRLLSPRVGCLASASICANSRRMASVLTPLTLAVSISCTILFTPTTLAHAAERQRAAGLRANSIVTATGGVTAQTVAEVRSRPGVTAVTEELHRAIRIGADKYSATGMTATAIAGTVDLQTRSGSAQAFNADSIALSDAAASNRHARVGDQLQVTLGDGAKIALVVSEIYGRSLGFGDAVLPIEQLRNHVDQPLADDLLVTGPPPTALARSLADDPGVQVFTSADHQTSPNTTGRMSPEVGYLAMGMIITFTLIAVANTLATATSDRTREFAALRLIGMKRRQVLRMLATETISIALVAVMLGTLISAAILLAYSAGMTTGSSVHAPPTTYAAVAVTTLLIALLSVAIPGGLALNRDPASVINAMPR